MAHAVGYPRQSFAWSSARDRDELFSVLPLAWSRRDKLRGASTISQQLAKNLYLSSSRNPLRKVKEAVTTYRLESALGKRRIMELYLNVAELGDGIWGAEAASRKYFKRGAARLTQEQAAALAGSLPFPLSSNPGFKPSRMRWRRDLILRRMHGEWVEVPKVETEDLPAPPVPDSLYIAVDSAVTAVDSIPLVQTESLPAPPDSLETAPDSVP
jgi:monofunctional biosynthetic peptidoglycan transglycosylase